MDQTKEAVELFREMEYAAYLLEVSELRLERVIAFGDIDKDIYNRQADEIRAGFQAKRESLRNR